MLIVPVNVSEGSDERRLDACTTAAGSALLDLHRDEHHNRAVLTLAGPQAAQAVAAAAVATIDLRRHSGVHPRLGAVDVVPFVPCGASTIDDAIAARTAFVDWAAAALRLPGLPYGVDGPSLPEVRRRARREVMPHPTAGAVAVGARLALVAFNVWLAAPDMSLAQRVAAAVRRPEIRALGLPVGGRAQVSMNLVAPGAVGPAAAFDAVAALAPVAGAELVGLVPAAVLAAVPEDRWAELDLSPDRTIEARLERAGLGSD